MEVLQFFIREDTAGEFIEVEVFPQLAPASDKAGDARDVYDVRADV